MAYIAFKPTDYFNPKLFSGTAAAQSITGVGFQPTFVWGKSSVSNNHQLLDAVRGTGNPLESDTSDIQASDPGSSLSSFDADGFTLAGGSAFNPSGTDNVICYNWKLGTTSGITTNASSTITPSAYSFNATAKQSIIAYTGNSTTGAGVPHGLGVKPDCIIIKPRNLAGQAWLVYHKDNGTNNVAETAPEDYYMQIDSTSGLTDAAWFMNDTAPDTTNFYLGVNNNNNNAYNYVAYCFQNIKGYFRAGRYMGNNNANGPTIYTGFKPSMIIIKKRNDSGAWYLYDIHRAGYNQVNDELYVNTNAAQGTGNVGIDLYGNGFKILTADGALNASESKYLYMAWGANPIVGSGGVPGLAR